jgi:hypothetical protein
MKTRSVCPLSFRSDVYYSEIWFWTVDGEMIVTYGAKLRGEWMVGVHEGEYEPTAFGPKPPLAPTDIGMREIMQGMWQTMKDQHGAVVTDPIKCELRCMGSDVLKVLRRLSRSGKMPPNIPFA